jgi:putative Holliday junction resolvase
MTRWAGIDHGKRRLGLALSDPGETIASPATTLDGTGTASEDARAVLRWAAENEVEGFVVGLPLNMDGSPGPQAKLSEDFADQLHRLGNLPVELWDERLSSFQADQHMQSALAAQVILQSFLDARRAPTQTPEE